MFGHVDIHVGDANAQVHDANAGVRVGRDGVEDHDRGVVKLRDQVDAAVVLVGVDVDEGSRHARGREPDVVGELHGVVVVHVDAEDVVRGRDFRISDAL